MANLIAVSQVPLYDGMPFTFRAACDCTEITGLTIKHSIVSETGYAEASKTFTFVDAQGTVLTGLGNLFSAGAYVRVILDTAQNRAYIQNATTNAYWENKFNNRFVLIKGEHYDDTLPASGTPGRLFFKKVSG